MELEFEGLRQAMRRAFGTLPTSADTPPPPEVPLTVRKAVAYLPVSTELLNPPEPTPEDLERWRAEKAERKRELTERIAGHPVRVAAASSPLREVLELHAPVTEGTAPWHDAECHGEDMDGMEAEWPEWPCRTYRLIAGWD